MAWKPIETAPKSDVRVVVFSARWGDMAICRWSNGADRFVLDVADNFRDDDFWFYDPTHWDNAPDEPACSKIDGLKGVTDKERAQIIEYLEKIRK